MSDNDPIFNDRGLFRSIPRKSGCPALLVFRKSLYSLFDVLAVGNNKYGNLFGGYSIGVINNSVSYRLTVDLVNIGKILRIVIIIMDQWLQDRDTILCRYDHFCDLTGRIGGGGYWLAAGTAN